MRDEPFPPRVRIPNMPQRIVAKRFGSNLLDAEGRRVESPPVPRGPPRPTCPSDRSIYCRPKRSRTRNSLIGFRSRSSGSSDSAKA